MRRETHQRTPRPMHQLPTRFQSGPLPYDQLSKADCRMEAGCKQVSTRRGALMKFSIVTISFNQDRFLQETLDSIRVSPPHELQYVIVDPGSTDGSRQRIERNRRLFHRIILEKDHGPADGLNKGFAACDGDIYAYVNSDDTLTPHALDSAARYFERRPETDVLFGGVKMEDDNGQPVLRGRTPDRFDQIGRASC